jgi:transglutaminase-like putative cysteine protease
MASRLALWAAILAVGAAFGLLFEGNGGAVAAKMVGAAVVGALVGSAGAYRFLLMLPAALFYGVLVVYGAGALVPTGGNVLLDSLQSDVLQALATMYAQPIPYETQPGLVLLLAPAVVLISALSVSATAYEESPIFTVAILGSTLGVISTVSFESGVVPYFAVFLAAAVALLALTGGSGIAGLGVRGLVAAMVVVGAALVLPNTPAGETAIRPAMVDWTEIGSGETSRLATEADVGPYLDSGRDAELMIVRSAEPLYWRGGTLDRFDGVRWSSTREEGDSDGEEIAPGVETETVRQSVEILEAETSLVFGGYNIREVSRLDAEPNSDGSWSVSGRLEEGERYGVVSEIPQPTEEQLSSSGTAYPQQVRTRFLQMPGDAPREVPETAGLIRREYSPGNPYETARAIQRYLLYDGGFSYNLEVDYRRADRALEEFLGEGREGFCTQFATSMALVAREMGVPSRVVYGATTGEEVNENEYVVRGANMHTWVEIYFPGVGWYPFDPTPGLGVTDAMEQNAPSPDSGGPSYSDDMRAQSPASMGGAGESPWTEGGDAAQPEPQDSPASTEEAGSTGGSGFMVYALLSATGSAALFAVPTLKAAMLRRGRPEDYYRDIVGRLEDSMPGRSPGRASQTPLERLCALAREAGLSEEPFSRLARAYSEHLYSPRLASGAQKDLASVHAEALDAYSRLPRFRRTLAAVNPASVARRFSAALSRRAEEFPASLWRPRGAGRR